MINNSRNIRAARWLRNKWFGSICGKSAIPLTLMFFALLTHKANFPILPTQKRKVIVHRRDAKDAEVKFFIAFR